MLGYDALLNLRVLPMRAFMLMGLVWMTTVIQPAGATQAGEHYLGAATCAECHQEQFDLWRKSDHYHAMEPASAESVLGDFSGVSVRFHGAETKLFSEGGQYFAEVTEAGATPEKFHISYTFGHYPLQQYLVELEDGFIQALNIAWDSRPATEGGQQWFHLQPDEDIDPAHPFHWKNHFQNWNSRCADCHSTNLRRQYDTEKHSYQTTWSEINVACESCHGPGGEHVERARAGNAEQGNSGLTVTMPRSLQWVFTADSDIASTSDARSDQEINMCGSCHSLRSPLVDVPSNGSFHDSNRIQLINNTSYFTRK